MAKPQQCSHCDKPATIHLTQIIDDEVHKIDMCEDCAHSKGLTDVDGFSFPEIEKKEEEEIKVKKDQLYCEMCGTTFEDYKKTGRLGSGDCYEVFKEQLDPLLEKMHRSIRHVGKFPKNVGEKSISFLKNRLKEFIELEDYEEAANIRDKIKSLEKGE